MGIVSTHSIFWMTCRSDSSIIVSENETIAVTPTQMSRRLDMRETDVRVTTLEGRGNKVISANRSPSSQRVQCDTM